MNTHTQALNSPSLGRVWALSWRIMVVGFGAWFSAELIYDAVKAGGSTKINIATTGVAASTLVAFFADFVALYEGCASFLKGIADTLKDLNKQFWKAWVSLTLIFLSAIAWASPTMNPEPWIIVYSNQPALFTERRISTVPALFKRDATLDWTRGIAFNDEELDVSVSAIGRILSAYAACGSVMDKPQVEMTIKGYASSRQFENVTLKDSNLLNVETANRRAWNAYCFTAGSVPVDLMNPSDWKGQKWACPNAMSPTMNAVAPIKIRVTYWPDTQSGFEAMTKERPIQDWPDNISETQKRFSEELTRRVDFYLNHAGACQVPTAPVASIAANTATNQQSSNVFNDPAKQQR